MLGSKGDRRVIMQVPEDVGSLSGWSIYHEHKQTVNPKTSKIDRTFFLLVNYKGVVNNRK